MTSLKIDESAIPDLTGKVAVVTGGASGIGLEAVKLMLRKGAVVHILDRYEPADEVGNWREWPNTHFHTCNVTNWPQLRDVMTSLGPFHMAFANAGLAEKFDYFADEFDSEGKLQLPDNSLLNVNLWGVLYTVKLAWSLMRRHSIHGSIVITASTTGYAPEAALPVYSAGKFALVGLVRSLRHNTVMDHITINAVAPAGTLTPLIADQVAPLKELGVIFGKPEVAGLALVYSATAMQDRRVEPYGRDREADIWKTERWNGRIIYVLGDTFTELEEPTADLRPFWFGKENHRLTRSQQAATDIRQGIEQPRM
ncbi:NAD(P)-binding protein [Xylaria bambusicola]|uniref:NAD(P)-binding protein n=1 Tax=Xylaria bambusicola TaxID=326684 RepID=UPI002007F5D2|nr:NAD(P)-binding protein [Xylaria bambusicola]KAI0516778.1 NAD(P)-binding protein [Xylaria bambusicola]